MSVDKSIQYEIQGGVKNYLGKQKEVKAPIKWKSSPDHPETELAYITKAEKDLLVKKDLHGSLKGGVNKGPSGIMSLNGYGSIDKDTGVDTGMSGTATSAAEAGGGSGADARELAAERGRVRSDLGLAQLPPGVVDQDVQDYRDAFIAAGGGQRVNPGFLDSRDTVSRAELARAKAFNPDAFRAARSGGLGSFFTGGGFLGNIIRAIANRFGLGKRYNEPTYDMSEFSKLGLGGVDPTVNPTFQNDLGNEGLLKLIKDEDRIKRFTDMDLSFLKNNPDLQALYERDKRASLLNNFGDTTVPSSSYDMAGINTPFAQLAPDQKVSQFLPDTNIFDQQNTKFQKKPELPEFEGFIRPELKKDEGGILDLKIPGLIVSDRLL